MPTLELMTRDTILERYRERIALGRRTKLFSAEFEVLIQSFIQRLAKASSREAIQQVCAAEIALLEEGYKRATLASDYIPKYRKAIERAIEDGVLTTSPGLSHEYTYQQRVTGISEDKCEHWALTFFKYDREVYEDLDLRQAQLNRRKLLSLQAVNPHRYLEVLNELLQSKDKFQDRHMAVAIAGLTGRRLGEVLARGAFALTNHPYLLHFEGQQKYERSGYDIVTLIPAPELLLQIEKFRTLPEIKGLMKLQGETLTQAINKFDVQVNRECHKYLSRDNLVPPLENRKRVTVHNLRSLWGAIAAWMFCPPQQHEYAFIQNYLGHVLESSATGHYFRYRLVDGMGNVLREQGTMLNQVPALPLFEDSAEEVWEESMGQDLNGTDQKKSKRGARKETQPAVDERPLHAEANQMELLGAPEQLQAALRIEWQKDLDALRQEILAQVAKLSKPTESEGALWLAARVQSLEQENQRLVQANQVLVKERDLLKREVEQTQQNTNRMQCLEEEKQWLSTQLNEAQAKLDGFRKLLLGNDVQENATQPVALGAEAAKSEAEATKTEKAVQREQRDD